MKRILMIVTWVGFLLGACAPAATEMEASGVWARTGMQGGNGAAYMTLVNGTSVDDDLLSASSDVAEAVEIHESRMDDNGVMTMIQQESVPLAAGAKVEFKQGGLHIMLVGLRRELKVGDTFEVTLHFKNHADIVLTVEVKEGKMDM